MGMRPTIILGLESSCDETAAALVADGREVLSSVVASQDKLHERYGGVVPEIAARAHIENILPVLHEALARVGVGRDRIDAVAVAHCPGLTAALLIAVTCAKTLAWVWQKPLIAIDHLHSHLQSVMLEEQGKEPNLFPAVALVVSGGHTSLYYGKNPLELQLIGYTLDDAAGEAFDKTAHILKLPYPGGPALERLAQKGDPRAVDFPRTYLGKGSLNFSFSGVKTAVLYYCRGQNMLGKDRVPEMTEQEKADIAASFQAAIIDVLVDKTLLAAERFNAPTVFLGGGVAANLSLRNQLIRRCQEQDRRLIAAARRYCTDNAAMVAGLAYYKLKAAQVADLSLEPYPLSPDLAAINNRRR